MPIVEIVTLCPAAKPILAEYGLHCFSCSGSSFETLEEGCRGHWFEEEDIDELVDDLNAALRKMPVRPQTLTVTPAAAQAIKKIAANEWQNDEGLAVTADAMGGFCMEFRPCPKSDEKTFQNSEEPSVCLFASTLTLARIGGATIDFREDRFKLDLPEDAIPGSCGCSEGSCRCGQKMR